jgi:hypothetical protein
VDLGGIGIAKLHAVVLSEARVPSYRIAVMARTSRRSSTDASLVPESRNALVTMSVLLVLGGTPAGHCVTRVVQPGPFDARLRAEQYRLACGMMKSGTCFRQPTDWSWWGPSAWSCGGPPLVAQRPTHLQARPCLLHDVREGEWLGDPAVLQFGR